MLLIYSDKVSSHKNSILCNKTNNAESKQQQIKNELYHKEEDKNKVERRTA